ncbi:TRAP transporter large permease [Marinivivus vitaminiproducens]|uniref:TRAP transporter large permease n=1 Tax=Marinivivus vitaminiproducens TaxID=3035935 RepID=UPI0027A4B60F|nr:TRAP transporter large permease [Geminicoccaceae bacterium SCSIO 64248]
MAFAVIAVFCALFLLGLPVAVAVAIPAIIYILANDFPLQMIAQRMTYALDSFPLVAIPVFIFVGNLMNQSGITAAIYRFTDTLVGRVPGGVAQVNVVGSLIFSGMSGAALADVGGIGKIEVKAMTERGHSPAYAGALTCCSAIVGPIFPPSIPLIVYGAVTGVSIIQLFLAGIVPALLFVAMLMVAVGVIAIRHRHPRADHWPSPARLARDLLPALPALLTPVLMVAGMLLGFFTPTEAASVTAFYAIAISFLFYGGLTGRQFLHTCFETIKSTGAILLIVSAASMFGWILAVEQVPQTFARTLLGLSTDPMVLLLLANLILLVAGMFLDSTTATLLVVPILAPPLHMAGIDPVHLGIVVVFNLMIGLVTPPLGLALFLITDIAKTSMRSVLSAMIPLYIPLIITLVLLTYVPQVSLWIPMMVR